MLVRNPVNTLGGGARERDEFQHREVALHAERRRRIGQVARDTFDATVGAVEVDPERTDEDDERRAGVVDAEPDDREDDPRERRDRSEHPDEWPQPVVERIVPAHRQPETDSTARAEEEARDVVERRLCEVCEPGRQYQPRPRDGDHDRRRGREQIDKRAYGIERSRHQIRRLGRHRTDPPDEEKREEPPSPRRYRRRSPSELPATTTSEPVSVRVLILEWRRTDRTRTGPRSRPVLRRPRGRRRTHPSSRPGR